MIDKTSVLIDTNIFLDSALNRNWEDNITSINNIFALIEQWQIHWLITIQSISTCWYLLQKHTKDTEWTNMYIKYIAENFIVQWWNNSTILKALDLSFSDTEDAILAQSAYEAWVDFIITNNLKDFINSPVEALNPIQFLIATEQL